MSSLSRAQWVQRWLAAIVLNENDRDLYHIDGECDARVCVGASCCLVM
jgi:hypothetical protein